MITIDPKEVKNEEEQQEFGHIIIRFKQLGSVFFDFEADGIVPMQMIAIGEYLSTMGKNQLLQELARVQMETSERKIMTAQPNIDPTALVKAMKK